ncbi:cobalamin biosynthesis protein CbiX [Streptomyces carminius]|uniref:Cobalamin biosynthesis protein CbiX n=1 Tax=Streptomyces carminius TaxID=2665496 RepID=A0A2M8LPB9_9ACTN|nr:sirohydrochlorin chelatase [Streptomyces carminius]PJE93799.1 cobalamin biosynthesis protein CbiX [Streptomyces carminius]
MRTVPPPSPYRAGTGSGAGRPALLVVAHGSRDPRHAATVAALCARLRTLRPGVRVEVGHLDFNAPSVPRTLARLHDEGVRRVVALPLLLTRAFHAKADIPQVLGETAARLPRLAVRQAGVLGPDRLLTAALRRRLRQAGLRPGDECSTGVVLASAGSSDPEAIAVIAEIAREWRRTAGWCAVRPAFASAALPRTADAVRELRAAGVRRVAVAPYVIAPGFLPDRIAAGAREAGADVLAPVLGDAPELAALLARRYDEAAAAWPETVSPTAGGLPISA